MRNVTDRTLRATVDRRGWAVMEVRSTADLLSLADSLGDITPSRAGGPPVDELRPKPSSQAQPRSLSGQHGLGAFPYHTDAAHHLLPPHYVLLRFASECPSARRTLLASIPRRIGERDRQILEHDVWLVDGGRGRFLTSILSYPDGCSCEMFRFDEGCMRPADKAFGGARAVILRVIANRSVAIEWVPTRTVVLDNWRTLHAREGARLEDADRVLERVLVSER
jgi:L-asparagine oxygenase